MTTNQEARQIAIRDVTSTTGNTSSDWHALFDDASIAAGPFNARMLAWINDQLGTSYTNLPGAMHAYAVDQGFSSWASMASFTPGSSLSAYAVNDNDPATVADFAGILNSGTAYYRTGGSATTFEDMFTFSRSGNATMVDSDGNLKWAPHNLLAYSEQFDNLAWTKASASVTANAAEAPDGNITADKLIWANAASSGGSLAQSGYDRGTSSNPIVSFTLSGAGSTSIVAGSPTNYGITSVGNGWYYCFLKDPAASGRETIAVWAKAAEFDQIMLQLFGSTKYIYVRDSVATVGDGSSGVYIWGAHVYRSDLGGMVDNPDRGDSYVPTTSAARYLARRGHHRWTGSSYVNKGILRESAARTNLLTHSNTLTSWSVLNTDSVTLTANDAVGLDGSNSLTRVAITDTTTEAHGIFLTPTATVATNTYSCYVHLKPGTQQHVALRYFNATGRWCVVVADLSGLTVTQESVGATSGTINDSGLVEVADGIYMLYMQITITDGDTGSAVAVEPVSSGTPTLDASSGVESYSGTAGLYFHAGYAQLELGATPSSYIPTSGATATRPAEALTITGGKMAASTTAMSFQMQGEFTYADNNIANNSSGNGGEIVPFRWATDDSNLISVELATNTTNTGRFVFRQEVGGSSGFSLGNSPGYTPGVNVAFNWASRNTNSEINGATDGTAHTVDTSPASLVDLSAATAALGVASTTTGASNGPITIALFRQWDVDLTDAGIEEATS